ncbi:MAG TPA: D-amino acid aminotransferase [Sedimenticola thiotaurini]|uniref:Aminodeoxychorismate lyase n=1 Tax=Sedimenticola thiotaurini TaxID=1543721 RepID=A0A831RMV7_9GAMM|nr:D-amino acid aminotransferase [Sedimenticola thiotaurini]
MNDNPPQVYLNGQFLPLERACIPVLDRGFLFGDGVYEVIPAYRKRLFRLPHHLQRLDNSLHGIRMQPPLNHDEWRAILERLLAPLPDGDYSVYLQVTRGVAAERNHTVPQGITPTLFAMASPLPVPPPAEQRPGIAAITLDDLRWKLCNIKAITLLANVLVREQARDQDAAEAILVRDGLVMEGAASNLFMVTDGTIVTPPKSRYLLPGITRDLILELAGRHRLPCREEEIPLTKLRQADEIWITSSTKEMVAVTRLDGETVGNGRPGPIFCRTAGLFADYKEAIRAGEVD